jgi:hypothetical protein
VSRSAEFERNRAASWEGMVDPPLSGRKTSGVRSGDLRPESGASTPIRAVSRPDELVTVRIGVDAGTIEPDTFERR